MMEDADTILVRLKDAVPYTSTWIGSVPSTAADLSNPANWASTNAIGAAVSAAPTLVTTVIIPADKLGSFSLPADASVNWGRIFFGGQATATHYGFKDGSPDSLHNAWRNLALTSYSNVGTVPDDSNDISYLTATQDTPGTPAELGTAQIRLEGWFYVTAAQAGRWSMPSYFDDVLSFAIDGEWVLLNSTYLFTNGAGAYVSEGWHRFTLAAADTGGGWGSRYKFAEGVFVPFVVSINGGANIQFSSDNFTFGSGEVTVTLSDDLRVRREDRQHRRDALDDLCDGRSGQRQDRCVRPRFRRAGRTVREQHGHVDWRGGRRRCGQPRELDRERRGRQRD